MFVGKFSVVNALPPFPSFSLLYGSASSGTLLVAFIWSAYYMFCALGSFIVLCQPASFDGLHRLLPGGPLLVGLPRRTYCIWSVVFSCSYPVDKIFRISFSCKWHWKASPTVFSRRLNIKIAGYKLEVLYAIARFLECPRVPLNWRLHCVLQLFGDFLRLEFKGALIE